MLLACFLYFSILLMNSEIDSCKKTEKNKIFHWNVFTQHIWIIVCFLFWLFFPSFFSHIDDLFISFYFRKCFFFWKKRKKVRLFGMNEHLLRLKKNHLFIEFYSFVVAVVWYGWFKVIVYWDTLFGFTVKKKKFLLLLFWTEFWNENFQ